jgi:NADH dehydrogenase
MGVEVRCGLRVQSLQSGRVEFHTGEVIEAANIVWAAGVGASPLTAQLGAPLDRSGRVQVCPDLRVPGHPEIFVIGGQSLFEESLSSFGHLCKLVVATRINKVFEADVIMPPLDD